jgi:hypothetical protein
VFEAWLFEAGVQAFLCGAATQVKDSRLSADVVHGRALSGEAVCHGFGARGRPLYHVRQDTFNAPACILASAGGPPGLKEWPMTIACVPGAAPTCIALVTAQFLRRRQCASAPPDLFYMPVFNATAPVIAGAARDGDQALMKRRRPSNA